MPQAVIAEIGTAGRVVGLEAAHAIGHRVAAVGVVAGSIIRRAEADAEANAAAPVAIAPGVAMPVAPVVTAPAPVTIPAPSVGTVDSAGIATRHGDAVTATA